MSYHSQFGEDRWIAENLKPPERGIFCEVGAFDGIQSSNTLYFEEDLGWTGICIEPDGDLARQCRANRKAVTVACACRKNSWEEPFKIWGWKPNLSDLGQSKLSSMERDDIIVPTFRLDFLCRMLCCDPYLLSIDTEGSELGVWGGCSMLEPKIVIIEYLSGDGVDRSQEIAERLTADGYQEVHRTEANLIFTRA